MPLKSYASSPAYSGDIVYTNMKLGTKSVAVLGITTQNKTDYYNNGTECDKMYILQCIVTKM